MNSSASSSVFKLLKRLPLLPSESVVSFVQRHCWENRAARMLHILRLIEELSGERVADVRDIVFSRAALRAVEYLTGLAEGTLNAHYVHRLQNTHLVTGHHIWRKASYRPRQQAICPLCIRQAPYGRTSWEYPQAPVCSEHAVVMLEACPSCVTPLRFSRRRLTHCEKCDFALETAAVAHISESALRVARLVQNPAMVAMGDAGSTAPIDAEDLVDLLRLCLPSGHGRASSYGLFSHPGDASVHDRVQALERLGSAIYERRIDSAGVRSVVMERWPGMHSLPLAAQLEHLQEVALEMEMDAELVRLLCHGDEAIRSRRASDVFDGRPPQLKTDYEVAEFLGLDIQSMRMLQDRDELFKAEDDIGYDMDHVLNLQNRLAAWCSPEDVDRALGMDGLAQALLDLRVLSGLKSIDGTFSRIQPQSFAALMSRIQSVIDPRPKNGEVAVPLAQVACYLPPGHVAWIVSQVASGSLAAYSWPTPQHLAFLHVDDRRLRVLMNQLNSSSTLHEESAT